MRINLVGFCLYLGVAEVDPKWDGHREMAWSNNDQQTFITPKNLSKTHQLICPSCGHALKFQDQSGVQDLPGLPAGVKFDPSDQEILQHLEAKVCCDAKKLHPLIDEFIPTIDGENGICYTHPEKLPGVSKEGQVRHFFHRPSKAYTTGTRKRRKVHTDDDVGGETRWHKTGKTRPVCAAGNIKLGYKKILVLYTNYGRRRKPEKTNWVMHQYHLGHNEEENDGELVVSKVFYQTQPRQSSAIKPASPSTSRQCNKEASFISKNHTFMEFYNPYNSNCNQRQVKNGSLANTDEESHNFQDFTKLKVMQ